MSWRSDEFHHRSAERSGWAAELRAADPEEVDPTVSGAVAYAAETSSSAERDAGEPDRREEVVDPTTVAGPADAVTDSGDARADAVDESGSRESAGVADETAEAAEADGAEQSERRCAFCADPVAVGEALDAAGVPFHDDAGFEWAGDAARYHRECIPDGPGRFLPWTASGVLADEGVE